MAKKLTESEQRSIEEVRAMIYAQVQPKETKAKDSKPKDEPDKEPPKEKPAPKKKKIVHKKAEIVVVITRAEYEMAGGNVRLLLNSTPKNLFDEEEEVIKDAKAEVRYVSFTPKRLKDKKEKESFMEKRRKIVREVKEEAVPISIPEEPLPEGEYATSLLDEEYKAAESAAFLIASDGKKIKIDVPVFKIGISKESDLVIVQDSKVHTVSRNHAVILTKNDSFYLKDLSSNGTFIGLNPDNLFRIPKGNEVELKNNMLIKFAGVTYAFSLEE